MNVVKAKNAVSGQNFSKLMACYILCVDKDVHIRMRDVKSGSVTSILNADAVDNLPDSTC